MSNESTLSYRESRPASEVLSFFQKVNNRTSADDLVKYLMVLIESGLNTNETVYTFLQQCESGSLSAVFKSSYNQYFINYRARELTETQEQVVVRQFIRRLLNERLLSVFVAEYKHSWAPKYYRALDECCLIDANEQLPDGFRMEADLRLQHKVTSSQYTVIRQLITADESEKVALLNTLFVGLSINQILDLLKPMSLMTTRAGDLALQATQVMLSVNPSKNDLVKRFGVDFSFSDDVYKQYVIHHMVRYPILLAELMLHISSINEALPETHMKMCRITRGNIVDAVFCYHCGYMLQKAALPDSKSVKILNIQGAQQIDKAAHLIMSCSLTYFGRILLGTMIQAFAIERPKLVPFVLAGFLRFPAPRIQNKINLLAALETTQTNINQSNINDFFKTASQGQAALVDLFCACLSSQCYNVNAQKALDDAMLDCDYLYNSIAGNWLTFLAFLKRQRVVDQKLLTDVNQQASVFELGNFEIEQNFINPNYGKETIAWFEQLRQLLKLESVTRRKLEEYYQLAGQLLQQGLPSGNIGETLHAMQYYSQHLGLEIHTIKWAQPSDFLFQVMERNLIQQMFIAMFELNAFFRGTYYKNSLILTSKLIGQLAQTEYKPKKFSVSNTPDQQQITQILQKNSGHNLKLDGVELNIVQPSDFTETDIYSQQSSLNASKQGLVEENTVETLFIQAKTLEIIKIKQDKEQNREYAQADVLSYMEYAPRRIKGSIHACGGVVEADYTDAKPNTVCSCYNDIKMEDFQVIRDRERAGQMTFQINHEMPLLRLYQCLPGVLIVFPKIIVLQKTSTQQATTLTAPFKNLVKTIHESKQCSIQSCNVEINQLRTQLDEAEMTDYVDVPHIGHFCQYLQRAFCSHCDTGGMNELVPFRSGPRVVSCRALAEIYGDFDFPYLSYDDAIKVKQTQSQLTAERAKRKLVQLLVGRFRGCVQFSQLVEKHSDYILYPHLLMTTRYSLRDLTHLQNGTQVHEPIVQLLMSHVQSCTICTSKCVVCLQNMTGAVIRCEVCGCILHATCGKWARCNECEE